MQHGRDQDIRAMSPFEIYLRTGRLPRREGIDGDIEVKFNPWHDPDDGRFTFSGTGVYYGRGGRGVGAPGAASSAPPKNKPGAKQGRPPVTGPARKPWGGGGFAGGGGGDFRGGGATAAEAWGGPKDSVEPTRTQGPRPAPVAGKAARKPPIDVLTRPASPTSARAVAKPRPALRPAAPADRARTEVKNGYRFEIDRIERTQLAGGELGLDSSEGRSRRNQAEAGKPDRFPRDDGGHFIAVRFNGPRDKFNHFAQESGSNRGRYRAIEDVWARSLKAGRRVVVSIDPEYEGSSRRPYEVDVTWWIDGKQLSAKIPNRKEN